MSHTQALSGGARLVDADAALADALIARAPFIFPKLTSPHEVRAVLMKLLSLAQINLLAIPLQADARESVTRALREMGCCANGTNRDHTHGMAALKEIQAVLSHAGQDDLAEAVALGFKTLCQRMKAN